jgi:hypothetical protein
VSDPTVQGSGADLARQALAAARAAAKTAPAPARKTGTRITRHQRGPGRDPIAFGTLLGRVSAEQGWPKALEGGDVLARWAELCPQFADTVQPAGYDPERGVLQLRPSSHAIASGLRILGGQLAKQINDKMGSTVVQAIRVLPVGTVTDRSREIPDEPSHAAEPLAPVRTRETASPGYRIALKAALTHRTERQPTTPHVADAIERQEAALRANREPESHHRDAVWEIDRLAAQQADRGEAVRRAAIARKRADQAAAGQAPRRAFDAA